MITFSRKFRKLKNPASWRRIAVANWQAPNDPTVYGKFDIDMSACIAYLEKLNERSEPKVTVTHLVAKVTALILAAHPDLNGLIRRGKIWMRDTVDIFLQVAISEASPDEKPDLSGVKINECDKKSLQTIAQELKNRSVEVRKKTDKHFRSTLGLLKIIPDFLLAAFLRFMSFLMYDLGIVAPKLGLIDDPFGSAMVTSVGPLGMPPGFAPLVPVSRVPMIICAGEVRPKPWVVNGEVVVRPVMGLTVTFDHRFMDGLTGSRMAKHMLSIFAEPERYLEG